LEFNVPFQHKYGYIRDDTTACTTVQAVKVVMHCASRLTGLARRDNGAHCEVNALPPPRRVRVTVYYILWGTPVLSRGCSIVQKIVI